MLFDNFPICLMRKFFYFCKAMNTNRIHSPLGILILFNYRATVKWSCDTGRYVLKL